MPDIEKLRDEFKKDKEAWNSIYTDAAEDKRFLSDDKFAQWDEKDYNERIRTGRAAVTIDYLGQFIHQVANDIRMNTPTINIIPSDRVASEEVAEVLKGLIREIEYRSNADTAYDTASLNSIKSSLGFIRVDHELEGDGPEQCLVIKRIVNPLMVWIDRNSIEPDGSDSRRGTIIEKISVEAFKAKYPDAEVACFEEDSQEVAEKNEEDMISIAEMFVLEEDESGPVCHRYKLSGKEILEETTFPSKYIPIVPVYGEEDWVDGKRCIYSLIRKSKEAQRLFNLWKSLETDLLRMTPKAPIVAAAGQVEDFAEDWENPDKAIVLRYRSKDSDGQPVGPPQRMAPPQVPSGVVNASAQSVQDIKATMGIYNSGLGEQDNSISGIAVQKRTTESDVATYHFNDNLVKSITQVGRILVDAIPIIYDTPRVLNIVGMEEDIKSVGINGEIGKDQPVDDMGAPLPIDLNQGRFIVRVVTGPSYTTRRQETAQFLTSLVQSQPDFMSKVGDLLFKNMDVSGADALSERMKKLIDPRLLDEQVDPQVMQLQQQLEQTKALVSALQQELSDNKAELAIKAQGERNDAVESAEKIKLDREKLAFEQQKFLAEMDIQRRKLVVEELKARTRIEVDNQSDNTEVNIDAR